MPPATRAAAVPTRSSCCPASSLFDGPGIYGSARVPLSSALRAGGQRLALRDCARVDGVSARCCLQLRYPKKKKSEGESARARSASPRACKKTRNLKLFLLRDAQSCLFSSPCVYACAFGEKRKMIATNEMNKRLYDISKQQRSKLHEAKLSRRLGE